MYPDQKFFIAVLIIGIIIISLIPAFWGYKAGGQRKIGNTLGMLLGLFLSYLGVILVHFSSKINEVPVQRRPAVASPEELKKYKDLLDSGVITQTEFDLQKQKLLGV